MGHFKKDCKCLGCGCHFSIFSWHKVNKKHYRPYCPECGQKNAFVMANISDEREIYQVCGAQPITGEELEKMVRKSK